MKRLLMLTILFAMVMGLSGCSGLSSSQSSEESEDTSTTLQVFAMDTYISLTGYGDHAPDALQAVSDMLLELDALLSVTDQNSQIYAINHAGGQPVTVDAITQNLILFSQSLGDRCDGALDISIYPVALAWGFTTGDYTIPDADTLDRLLTLVDQSQIVVDTQSGTVTVPDGMQLDLGALVKGYAGDLAREILAEYGVEHALLNIGSSTMTLIGDKPDGSLWRIAIADPEDDTLYAGILTVSDCTIDTSGGYQRCFTDEDGNVYWHILDPATGCPADSGLISVTIISQDGLTGDALSTACFVMGLEDSIQYWRTWGDFDFVFITRDYDIYISQGIADSFTPTGNYESSTIYIVTDDDTP